MAFKLRYAYSLLGLIFLAASTRVSADPIAMYGVGGNLQPIFGAHRTIRLVEETIQIELPSRRVNVNYVFRNDGPATKVTMGFPESGQTGEAGTLPKNGFIKNFRSFVDGRRVATARFIPQGELGEKYESEYSVFWIKSVSFKRHQTRRLRDEYTAGAFTEMLGGPESGARQRFSYILQTGAAWKGNIKKVRVVFDVRGLRDFSETKFSLPGFKKISKVDKSFGDQIIYEAKNIEPKSDIEVSWWPGVRDFQINGQTPLERCIVVGKTRRNGEYSAVYPIRRNGKIWVPMRLLQQWFSGLRPEASRGNKIVQAALPTYIGLNIGARNLTAILGEKELEASEDGKVLGTFKMSAPAYLENGVAMIELAPAMQGLGGRIAIKNGVIQLWLK